MQVISRSRDSQTKVWPEFGSSLITPLLVAATAAAWLSPMSLGRSSIRVFNHALTLEANRREPPRLAFNLIASLRKPALKVVPQKIVNLNDVLLQSSEADGNAFLFRRLHPTAVWLHPMVISRSEFDASSVPDSRLASGEGLDKNKVTVRAPNAADQNRGPAPVGSAEVAENNAAPGGAAHVRLQEGLYVGDGAIELSLESGGHSTSIGYADAKTGAFDLPDLTDEELNNSFVVARVRAGNGEVIGQGRSPVRHVSAASPGQNTSARNLDPSSRNDTLPARTNVAVNDSFAAQTRTPAEHVVALNQIDIRPHRNNLAGNLGDYAQLADLSFRTPQLRQNKPNFRAHSSSPTLVTDEDLPASGHFEVPNVAHGSTSLFQFEKGSYQPSVYISQAGQEQQIPMLTRSVASALLSIAAEQRKQSIGIENKSIVWGRILAEQVPIAGVHVETNSDDVSQVVYFNALMLPDPALKATSANGFFAILHLPEGMHEIRAYQGGLFFGFANVIAERNTVSPTSIHSTKAKALRLFTAESAFDPVSQAVNLKLQSLTEPISTAERHQYFVSDNDQTGFMVVHPEDSAFADEVTTYNSSTDSPTIRLVPNSWLESIKQQLGGRLIPNTGIIMGFLNKANYKVFLPHERDNLAIVSIYFDAKGTISESPVEGGGFALFNIPQGIQSLVVVDQANGTAWTQVLNCNSQTMFVATPVF